MIERTASADGTAIAYERTGSGSPLVLVHGSLNDRGIWAAVVPALAQHFTVYAMDRRGRGDSGSSSGSAMERQFEDVAAVIEAASEPVALVGHSFGAHCALGAATMGPSRVKHLVLYEPPPMDRVRSLVDLFETQPAETAVAAFLEQDLGYSLSQVEAIRATPFFSYLMGFASTVVPEARALLTHGFDASRYASLGVPALLLQGSVTADLLGETMRELSGVMPRTEWHTFEGHGHGAMLTAAAEFADTVLAFLRR